MQYWTSSVNIAHFLLILQCCTSWFEQKCFARQIKATQKTMKQKEKVRGWNQPQRSRKERDYYQQRNVNSEALIRRDRSVSFKSKPDRRLTEQQKIRAEHWHWKPSNLGHVSPLNMIIIMPFAKVHPTTSLYKSTPYTQAFKTATEHRL